jgi:hypothetical protein
MSKGTKSESDHGTVHEIRPEGGTIYQLGITDKIGARGYTGQPLGELTEVNGTVQPAPATNQGLLLIDGGFSYRGRPYDLTGRPRALLSVILSSEYRRCSADRLRELMGINDEMVERPEQVVRDAAKDLRATLRQAVQEAGLTCDDPLPSIGRGSDLTYILIMP